jgi:hypothetical protein
LYLLPKAKLPLLIIHHHFAANSFFRENAKDITFHFTEKKEFITFLLGGSNYRKSAANILCRRQDYPSPFVLDLALSQTFLFDARHQSVDGRLCSFEHTVVVVLKHTHCTANACQHIYFNRQRITCPRACSADIIPKSLKRNSQIIPY